MFTALARLFASWTRLADETDAMADTMAEARAKFRAQVGLDGPPDKALPAPAGNGRRAAAASR